MNFFSIHKILTFALYCGYDGFIYLFRFSWKTYLQIILLSMR